MRRREVLKMAASAFSVAPFLNATAPAISFPAEPRERLAVASYPFRKERIPLVDFPAMVVERFRLRNIEPLGEHFESIAPPYLQTLQAAIKKAGVRIVNIPVSPRTSLYDPDPAKRAAGVADARRWVDVAAQLGAPSVRVHIEGVKGLAPNLAHAVESLRAIAAYGMEKNIVINLENDDPQSEEAGFIVRVIEQVSSPYLHALPDFCNSMLVGSEDYNYKSIKAMFAHAYNISHVKDSEFDEGRTYRVDVDRTFAIAKASGYRGFYSMEWEGQEDPFTGTAKLIAMSLKNLS